MSKKTVNYWKTRDSWEKYFLLTLLGVFVLVLATFKNYGISWDEEFSSTQGNLVLRWYLSGFSDKGILSGDYGIYGGLFNVLANIFARLLPFSFYESRHLLYALTSLGTLYGTFKIGTFLVDSKTGFFSFLLLLFTPTFYGHMFINPNDIPFAAVMTWGLYAILSSSTNFPHISLKKLIYLGFVLGCATSVRIGGVFLFFILLFHWSFILFQMWRTGTKIKIQGALQSFFIVMIVAGLAALPWWPYVQADPISHALTVLRRNNHIEALWTVFFNGHYVYANALPWTYIPKLFLITLPDFMFALFFIWILIRLGSPRGGISFPIKKGGLTVIVALFFPLFWVMGAGSTLYDNYRHLLFVIPNVAVLCGWLCSSISNTSIFKTHQKLMISGFLVLLTLTIWEMIHLHPYQYIYFNRLFGGGLPHAAKKYETDYWGCSQKEGVEWVLNKFGSTGGPPLRLINCTQPYQIETILKENKSQRKIEFVPRQEQADLLIATTRWNCHQLVAGDVLHVVEREGVPLLYVIQITKSVL